MVVVVAANVSTRVGDGGGGRIEEVVVGSEIVNDACGLQLWQESLRQS